MFCVSSGMMRGKRSCVRSVCMPVVMGSGQLLGSDRLGRVSHGRGCVEESVKGARD